MIRYVDDHGQVRVTITGLIKNSPTVQERRRGQVVTLKELEEDIKKKLENDKKSKAFFCLNLVTVLTIITAWEIISLWYYLAVISLRWASDCKEIYSPLLTFAHMPGLVASVILHPFGWLFLIYLPEKRIFVVCFELAVHILVTAIFFTGCVLTYLSSRWVCFSAYCFLTLFDGYTVVLYNSLMNDMSEGKYNIFKQIASFIGRIFDSINSKL